MTEWALWCGCRLPAVGIRALPDMHRLREEACAVCAARLPPHASAYRIPQDAVPRTVTLVA